MFLSRKIPTAPLTKSRPCFNKSRLRFYKSGLRIYKSGLRNDNFGLCPVCSRLSPIRYARCVSEPSSCKKKCSPIISGDIKT